MDYIIVQGGNKLKGTVKIEGAKNAALPILAATLLAEKGQTVLNNVPALSDVYIMVNILMSLNANVYFNHENNQVIVDATNDLNTEAPLKYVSQMRASIVVMGPLLARNGRAKVPMPGGCVIGKRPIDLHIKGLQALGATVFEKNGYIEAIANELKGARIYLDFPSVGATQNIMMAAVNAKGTTVIENAACEPEIVDLANILNKMGAKIKGMGTETIKIKGVEHLHAVKHTIIQDRIEAGTFMVAAAITGGNIHIREAIEEHNITLISKLREMGVVVRKDENGIRIIGTKYLKNVDIETLPYPGFPTDMQAQMSVLLMLANGTSILTENIFENRFQHITELIRMGAECKISGSSAFIYGESQLCGTEVAATDLRAAAALILAGLAAKGETKVTHLEYLDRGYYDFHLKLQKLNGNIERVFINIPY